MLPSPSFTGRPAGVWFSMPGDSPRAASTEYTGWHGVLGLYEHHAVLAAVPF